jgi:hypothetical protein
LQILERDVENWRELLQKGLLDDIFYEIFVSFNLDLWVLKSLDITEVAGFLHNW